MNWYALLGVLAVAYSIIGFAFIVATVVASA